MTTRTGVHGYLSDYKAHRGDLSALGKTIAEEKYKYYRAMLKSMILSQKDISSQTQTKTGRSAVLCKRQQGALMEGHGIVQIRQNPPSF